MESFQTRLAAVDKEQKLSLSAVSDIFSLVTEYFSPEGVGLRKECSQANAGAAIKKECCGMVRTVVDRLISQNGIEPCLVAETCSRLSSLVALLADDVVLLLVVWKEMFRIPSQFTDIFSESIDMVDLFSSLVNNAQTFVRGWCDGLVLGGDNPFALAPYARNAKILNVLLKHLAQHVCTFGSSLLSEQRGFVYNLFGAVFGAAAAYRHAAAAEQISPELNASLLKVRESLVMLFRREVTCTANNDGVAWPLVEFLATDATIKFGDGRVGSMLAFSPAPLLWFGRLEMLLFVAERNRAAIGTEGAMLLGRPERSLFLAETILFASENSFGFLANSIDKSGEIQKTKLQIVRILAFLFLTALNRGSTTTELRNGNSSAFQVVGLATVLEQLCLSLANPHPLRARITADCTVLFLASLQCQPTAQSAAIRFLAETLEHPCCAPSLFEALAVVIQGTMGSTGSLSSLAQSSLASSMPLTRDLREVLLSVPIFAGSTECYPSGLRLFTLAITTLPGKGVGGSFSDFSPAARNVLLSRCHEYAVLLVEVEQLRISQHQHQQSSPLSPFAVDLAIALLAPSSSGGSRELCPSNLIQNIADIAIRGSQAILVATCRTLDTLPPPASSVSHRDYFFHVAAALFRVGRAASLGLGGSLDAVGLLRAINNSLAASMRFFAAPLSTSPLSSASSSSPRLHAEKDSARAAILVEASTALASLSAVPFRQGTDVMLEVRELSKLLSKAEMSPTQDGVQWTAALRASLVYLDSAGGPNGESRKVVPVLSSILPSGDSRCGLLGIAKSQPLFDEQCALGMFLRNQGTPILKRKLKFDADAAVAKQDDLEKNQRTHNSSAATWNPSARSFELGIRDGQAAAATFDGTIMTLSLSYRVSSSVTGEGRGETELPQPFEHPHTAILKQVVTATGGVSFRFLPP